MGVSITELEPAVARFARLAVQSTDLDPAYPVLRELQRGLDPDAAVWSSVCFVGWYRLASSLQAPEHPELPEPWMLRLGTGIERRSLRTEAAMRRHWLSVLGRIDGEGSVTGWLRRGFTGEPRADWQQVRSTFDTAWGNGRWATYKLAEVLREVNGWPIEPTDMGNDGSTGPVAGLKLLYGSQPARTGKSALLAAYDRQGANLRQRLADRGIELNLAQVETVLCDFHNLWAGAYYVGHDIDVMLGDLLRPEVPGAVTRRILAARTAVVPPEYLGELNGWAGVDRERRKVYALTGEVLAR